MNQQDGGQRTVTISVTERGFVVLAIGAESVGFTPEQARHLARLLETAATHEERPRRPPLRLVGLRQHVTIGASVKKSARKNTRA